MNTEDMGTCPRCGSPTYEDNLASGCSNPRCDWTWNGNDGGIGLRIIPREESEPVETATWSHEDWDEDCDE